MPSGPKKRKAAKKKKEKVASSHDQNHHQHPQSTVSQSSNHENNGLNHHDDKESEGEEVSSPVSQDHPTPQHQFTDAEKEDIEKVEDSLHVQLSCEESKFNEELKDHGGEVKERVVQIEKEPNSAGELNGKHVNEEHVKAREESGDAVVSQSVEEESAVEIERELKLFEKLDASVQHVEPQKESNGEVLPENHTDEYRVIDKMNVALDNSPFGSSTEAVNSLPEGLTQVLNPVPAGKVYASVVEPGSGSVTNGIGLAGEKIDIADSIPGDSLLTTSVVQPGMEENGKKEMVVDENDRNLTNIVDLGLKNKRDEGTTVADSVARDSDAKNTLTKEAEEKLLLSSNAPNDVNCENANNGANHIKDCEVNESCDTQPLVASAARPTQRTSWMSCCGIFEVLAKPSR